jgi:archaellum component FlaC
VWEYIVSRLGNPEEIIKDIVKQQSDERRLEELKSKLKAIENKIHKKEQEQKRTFKAYREGLISLELFKGEVEPIKQEIEALKEEWAFVNDLYNQITVSYNELERIKQFIQGYREIVLKDQLTLSQKREIVRTIVERVILHQDTIEIITRWSGESKTHSNLNHSQSHGRL